MLELDSQPGIETLGLSLANGKAALAQLQARIVTRQVELMSASQRRCELCGLNRDLKDYHDVHYRSLFGGVVVRVPRWQRCACSPEFDTDSALCLSLATEPVGKGVGNPVPVAQ
ncbi:hypothetical protein [Variovorax sp. dw_954]|uniref:hypothetical protein n=1 Tax=Variovorax sp. dw_954 TaxID=2720078 RepID=UPI001BD2C19D|nr:hypothetical protein [Variovorax sp. dw_954]